MNKKITKRQKFINYLKHLNEYEHIKVNGTDKERLVFKNSEETFKLFGTEEKEVLNPFNDYTYVWLNSLLYAIIGHFERDKDTNIEGFRDSLFEHIDSEVDVYTSGLTEWLNSNNGNTYYLEEAIKEFPDKDNHLMLAQYKAIEEVFNKGLNIIEEVYNDFEVEE